MVDIFEYIDYRKLLKELYEERRAENKAFSYRFIAQKVGFSSAGFFANIIQGKRNISPEFIFGFARVFKLKKPETEYFELLVNFDQAKNHEQKKYYFEKILASKKSKLTIIEKQQYEFYSKWYYIAVREVLDIYKFRGDDYANLAKMVSPPITPAEAKKAVELLIEMRFIRKNKEGWFEQVDPFITTGYEAPTVAVTNSLMSFIDLAKEAIDRYPRDRRHMASLSFAISAEGYKAIEERLRTFRREILEIARADKKTDRIYHANFQIFPISRL
jgi:uncharacterized protein (TIGR02147 family)